MIINKLVDYKTKQIKLVDYNKLYSKLVDYKTNHKCLGTSYKTKINWWTLAPLFFGHLSAHVTHIEDDSFHCCVKWLNGSQSYTKGIQFHGLLKLYRWWMAYLWNGITSTTINSHQKNRTLLVRWLYQGLTPMVSTNWIWANHICWASEPDEAKTGFRVGGFGNPKLIP